MAHDVQMKMLEIALALVGTCGSALVTLKIHFVLKARQAAIESKLRTQEQVAKTNLAIEAAKRINADLTKLQEITAAHGDRLLTTSVECGRVAGKLEIALPLLRHVVEMMPRFAGAVESMDHKLEAMNARLTARPIPGSGGKTAIESPPTPKEKKTP